MTELLWNQPKVYRILVDLPENPLRNLNAYVLQDGGETLVIDTGFKRPECRKPLLEGLAELEVDWKRTKLFLTHLHSDHIGLLWEFLNRGGTAYMNQIDYAIASRHYPRQWAGLEQVYRSEGFPEALLRRQQRENQMRAFAPEFPFPAVTVGDGSVIPLGQYGLQCIHTPGHTPGHTVLYLPEQQLLFSGDHILFDITPNIGIWEDAPHALRSYLDSLEQMRSLPVKQTFPAHRSCQGDLYTRIDQLTEHHEKRLDELLSAIRQHPDSDAYTLAGYLTWSARGLGWDAFPPHQKWFATGETLAHLYHLVEQGRVQREEEMGRYTYSLGDSAKYPK